MSRKLHSVQTEMPYHVTARSHNGDVFRIPLPKVWRIVSDYLYFISLAYDVQIHSFVLMSNHFHLVVSTPRGNLSGAMNYFMREVSKEINRNSSQKNQVFGSRYYRSTITSNLHFEHVYKYVYRNPVTAGIVERCEDYKFSTLYGLLGRSRITIPVVEDSILLDVGCTEKTLRWINIQPNSYNYEVLKRALTRKTLKFPKNRRAEFRHSLEQMPL